MYLFKVMLMGCISTCFVAEVTVSNNVTLIDTLIVDTSSVTIVDVTVSIQSSLPYTYSDTNPTTDYESSTALSSFEASLAEDIINSEPSIYVVSSQLYLDNTDTVPVTINQSTPWSQADDSSFSTDNPQTIVIPSEVSEVDLTSSSLIIAASGVDTATSVVVTASGNILAAVSTFIYEETHVFSTSIYYAPSPDIDSSLESSYVGVQSDSLISNIPSFIYYTTTPDLKTTSGVDATTYTTSGNTAASVSTLIDEETHVLSTFINYTPTPVLNSSLESSHVGVQPNSLISNTPALYSETFFIYSTSVVVTSNTVISHNSVVYSETNVQPITSFGVHVTTSTVVDEESPLLNPSSLIEPSLTDDPSSEYSETNVQPITSFGVHVTASTVGDEESPLIDSSSSIEQSPTDDQSSVSTDPLTSHRQTIVHDTATVTLDTTYIEPAQTTESAKSVTSDDILLPTQSSTKTGDTMSTTSHSSVLQSSMVIDIDILNGQIAKLESDVTSFRTATIVLCVILVLIVAAIVGIFLYSRYRPRRRNPYIDDEDQKPIRRPNVRKSIDNIKSMLFRRSAPADDDVDNGRTNTTLASFKNSPKKHNEKSTSVVMQMKEKLDSKSDSHMYGKHEKMKFEIAHIPETKDENLLKTDNDNAGFSNTPDHLSEVDLTTD